MRPLLVLMIAALAISDIFAIDLSLAPGLSVKNAILNAIALSIVVRMVMQGNVRILLPGIQACFAIMFVYGVLSIFAIVLIVNMPHYIVMDSAISLKYMLFDAMLFFLTFLYGAGSAEDSRSLIRTILIAVTIANLITITNVVGITNIGNTVWGNNDLYEGGRVFGVFGHANETGTLIVCLLPAYVAVADSSKGLVKLFWTCGMMISLVMLVMTGSRGALLGLIVGSCIGAFLCRRYISFVRAIRWGAVFGLVGVPLLGLVGLQFGKQYFGRIIGQALSGDMSEMSSGRTQLWADALQKMLEAPLSIISGFGWGSYAAFGFKLIPHNYYFSLWFEIGLVGLFGLILILIQIVATLRSVLPIADQETRRYLVAAVFSTMILSVAIFFEQLFKPWFYLWPYLGLSLSAALHCRNANRVRSQSAAKAVQGRMPRVGVASSSN